MKHRSGTTTLVVVAILLCVATTTAEGISYLRTGGQAITGHKVVEKWEHASKVCFTIARKVPGGRFCVVMSNEILEGNARIASVHWHGDGGRDHFERTDPFSRNGIFVRARRIVADGPMVAVIRPHSSSKYDWRQMSEIRLHIVLVEYLSRTFGVRKFNLYGHSGGGLVAIAVAQERPGLTATVGLASPKLAVRIHYMRHEGGVPRRYSGQYDPIRRIGRLSPDIPVLVVYDKRDPAIKPGGVFPYIKKAEKRRKKVRLILVEANHRPHHTQRHLGEQLRKPENREFSTSK